MFPRKKKDTTSTTSPDVPGTVVAVGRHAYESGGIGTATARSIGRAAAMTQSHLWAYHARPNLLIRTVDEGHAG